MTSFLNRGQLYRIGGYGIERNSALAAEMYTQAAALDSTDALVLLADLYFSGDGVQQSFVTARALYIKESLKMIIQIMLLSLNF